MIFSPTDVQGVWIIDPERFEDDRGFFARSFCRDDFSSHGLNPMVAQCNISFNAQKGTLRGLHSQVSPWSEAKLIRCTRGVIFDVALDLRRDSNSYLQHIAVELSADNRRMLYVPEGVYHGFLTLDGGTEVTYQMSQVYRPDAAHGVRWNDPVFKIRWPEPVAVISERDRSFPDYIP